ncbi:MAG: methyltransferase [Acidimicrobiales bacterium]
MADSPTDQSDHHHAGHYFSESPTTASNERTISLTLPDVVLTLTTDRGMFSPGHVDVGTKYLLLDGPKSCPSDRIIADIGAGYGPIALVLASRNPDATIWAIDVNQRARLLCQRNAEANGLSNVVVAAPEDVPDSIVFDRIWSNPPIRIGKDALHDLLRRWLDQLAPQGSAHLVVQKHLGADSLARWLTTSGWPTTRRASGKAFRLLDVAAAVPPNESTS